LNPTIEVDNPNQKMLVKQSTQKVDFGFDNISNLIQSDSVNIEVMNWQKLANKNQYVSSVTWTVDTDTRFASIPIDYKFLTQLIPLGLQNHNFTKFQRIKFSIKSTNNSLFQGLAVLTVENFPTSTYAMDLFNIDTKEKTALWQFQKMYIQPNDTDEYNFYLPLNFPFRLFSNITTPENSTHFFRANYIKDYVLATINFTTIVPLSTTSTATKLVLTVSAQIEDLELAAINVTP